MSEAEKPIPKERWRGPPEGAPDHVRQLGGPHTGSGYAPSTLRIVGTALAVFGLGLLILGLIISGGTIAANLAILFGGLAAGVCGLTLTRAAAGRPAELDRANTPSSGCLWALMAIAGVLMLLPGVCSLLFGIGYLTDPVSGAAFVSDNYFAIFLSGWLIGAVGVGMIRWAIVGGSPAAGITTVVGMVLLLPGSYFALFGASRVHSRALLLIGLPAAALGVLLLRQAWQRTSSRRME